MPWLNGNVAIPEHASQLLIFNPWRTFWLQLLNLGLVKKEQWSIGLKWSCRSLSPNHPRQGPE